MGMGVVKNQWLPLTKPVAVNSAAVAAQPVMCNKECICFTLHQIQIRRIRILIITVLHLSELFFLPFLMVQCHYHHRNCTIHR